MDEIISAAKEGALTLAGGVDLSSEQRSLLQSFCDAAADALSARLRPGVSPADCANSLTVAIMLEAVELFRKVNGGEISRFEAAGVSVQLSGTSGMGERLLAPWLKGGAAFLGVRS